MVEDQDLATKHAQYYEKTPDLLQGTLLRGLEVLEESPDSTPTHVEAVLEKVDVIVLTQSCDIQKASQARLLVAEVETYADMLARREGTDFTKKPYRKTLIRNLSTSDMLLPPCAGLSITDYLIVNFRELHVIDKQRVPAAPADGYVGLASPFREQLSQMYAMFIMRVGLPTPPLHEFETYEVPPTQQQP